MSTFALIAIAVVILIGVLVALAARRPNEFRIERRMVIPASADAIFPLVNDLAAWRGWSPWEKKDPAMQRNYSAQTAGMGASYEWLGNREVGQGRMTVIESLPGERVRIRMDFLAPFRITHEAEFIFKRSGDGTEVVWAMMGKHPFIGKIMCLFYNPDDMVGRDFEAGLNALKQQVAGQAG
jgi:hypothetical protein